MKLTRKICAALLPAALITLSPNAFAQVETLETIHVAVPQKTVEKQYHASWHGQDVALRGRDVVSFSELGGPVAGSEEFVAEWDNSNWHFKSKENRDTFLADPERYAPEFGGYCPVALSRGEVKVGQTNQFTRVDEKLYLNYDKTAQEQFARNSDDYILKAQAKW